MEVDVFLVFVSLAADSLGAPTLRMVAKTGSSDIVELLIGSGAGLATCIWLLKAVMSPFHLVPWTVLFSTNFGPI